MKRLLISGLISVVLCTTSNLVLAAQDQNPQTQSQCNDWWHLWGWLPCATPSSGVPQIPTNDSTSSHSNQSNVANQNPLPLHTDLQSHPTQPAKPPVSIVGGWIARIAGFFSGSTQNIPPGPQVPTNSSVPDFGIVKGVTASAPSQQPIPEFNPPRTDMVQAAPPAQEVRTSASQPIPEPQATGGQSVQEQLARMTPAEKSRLNTQTDAAFYAKHPEMAGKKIDPTNLQAAQQWIAERNNILAANARAASEATTQQLSSKPISNSQQPSAHTNPIAAVPPTNAPLPTIPTFSARPGVSAPSTASQSTSYPPLPTIPQLPLSSSPQSAPPAHVPPAPQFSGGPIVNGHVASPQVAQQIQQNLQQNNFILPHATSSPPPHPQTEQAQQQQQQERQRQAQLAQQKEQERERQAQLAQQKEQERQRQAQLAQQKEQERQRQAQLAQQKEQERQRQAQLAQQKEQERQRQAQLAQRKEQAKLAQREQERQRQVRLAQQKEQERQVKAYKQWQQQQAYQQQEAYRQQQAYYQRQQAYRQQQAYEQQQRQMYQQQQQQQPQYSAEEYFYATHGGRNALTEAAWAAGAYTN